MRGFAVGTLALIVAYVVVQRGSADKINTASGWFQQGMKRWLAADVAGVPNRSKKTVTASTPATTTGGYYNT